jgi:hypothetical protein
MANDYLATDPEDCFGLAVSKIVQLSALLKAIRKSADPACSADGLEAVTLGELVDVAESVLSDVDGALFDYHEAVAGQSPTSAPAEIVLPFSESGQSDLEKSQKKGGQMDQSILTDGTEDCVEDQLAAEALEAVLRDHPEIEDTREYTVAADHYVNAFMAAGEPFDQAIRKAGEAVSSLIRQNVCPHCLLKLAAGRLGKGAK